MYDFNSNFELENCNFKLLFVVINYLISNGLINLVFGSYNFIQAIKFNKININY